MFAVKNSGIVLCFFLLLGLAGCAAMNPLDLARVDSFASPDQVRQDFARYQGRTVQWGGLIVNRLEEGATLQLEILSYPLHGDGNPDEYLQPTGLFLSRYTGDLDLAAYLPGRFVTVVGEIGALSPADGEAKGRALPLVTGSQLYLWGWRNRGDDFRPRTTFGFGLGLHL